MDELTIRKIAARSFPTPKIEDVRWLQANRSQVREIEQELLMQIDQAQITIKAIKSIERFAKPDVLIEGEAAYAVVGDLEHDHYTLHGVTHKRGSRVYRHANGKGTWGVNVTRFGHPARDCWLGASFTSKEEAHVQALRWIVEGIATTYHGEVITEDMIDMSYGSMSNHGSDW